MSVSSSFKMQAETSPQKSPSMQSWQQWPNSLLDPPVTKIMWRVLNNHLLHLTLRSAWPVFKSDHVTGVDQSPVLSHTNVYPSCEVLMRLALTNHNVFATLRCLLDLSCKVIMWLVLTNRSLPHTTVCCTCHVKWSWNRFWPITCSCLNGKRAV